ncbi:MAG: hypothetical protein R2861_15595 [Desulfobacterales bacterium]
MTAIAELAPSLSMDDFFHRMVITMNRLLQAEKGGLFWSRDQAPEITFPKGIPNLTDLIHNILTFRIT